jgi:Bacterial Ig domain/Chitobiase/beta-hexosaminidase C-terminal domain/Calcineurin-like phosphoesterase
MGMSLGRRSNEGKSRAQVRAMGRLRQVLLVPVVLTPLLVLAPYAASTASAAGTADPVIATAGDIACDPSAGGFNGGSGTATDCRQKSTAALLSGADAVLPLGDNQYNCGGASAFAQSYDPSWGQYKSISYPVPGNHEYLTSPGTNCSSSPNAAGYYSYFGSRAGDPTKGYYSYNLGSWHIIALNSECGYVASLGSCGLGSPEETWLRNDLAANSSAPCTLAYWHRPRFASTLSGGDKSYSQFWTDLYNAHADVVLAGHAHWYERFAQQNPAGQVDPAGIREFVVGTGGEESGSLPESSSANTQAIGSGVFGVLKMALHPGSYDWNFVREANSKSTFTDSGSTACHNAAPADTAAPTTTITCNGSPCSSTDYGSAVTVALSASDTGGSGVKSTKYTTDGTDPSSSASAVTYTGPFTVSQTTTVKFASVDNAGNQEAAQSQLISVAAAPADLAAPTTTISCNGSACSSTDYGSAVTVALAASDTGGSGVKSTKYTTDGSDPTTSASAVTYTAPFTVSQTTTVNFASVDNAGNQEVPQSQLISVAAAPSDTAAPTTTITCNGSACSNTDYGSAVTVALAASDTGGSGVKSTAYTTDGSDPTSSSTAVTYTGPFTVSQTTTVKYASVDNAGNQEAAQSQLISVAAAPSDTVAPTTAISCNGAACITGWYTSGVNVALSATDTGGSGIKATKYTTDGSSPLTSASAVTYTGPFTVSQTTTVKFASVDNAGNQEAAKTRQVRIDAAAPTVSITSPTDGASYKRGTNIVINAAATDAGTGSGAASGIASVTFYRDGVKIAADTSAPYSVTWSTNGRTLGGHTLTAVATDVAGNSTTSTVVNVKLIR